MAVKTKTTGKPVAEECGECHRAFVEGEKTRRSPFVYDDGRKGGSICAHCDVVAEAFSRHFDEVQPGELCEHLETLRYAGLDWEDESACDLAAIAAFHVRSRWTRASGGLAPLPIIRFQSSGPLRRSEQTDARWIWEKP